MKTITTNYTIGDRVYVLDINRLTILKDSTIDAILITDNTIQYKIDNTFYKDEDITNNVEKLSLWAKQLRFKIDQKESKGDTRVASYKGYLNPFADNIEIDANPITLSEKANLFKEMLKLKSDSIPWWWQYDTLN